MILSLVGRRAAALRELSRHQEEAVTTAAAAHRTKRANAELKTKTASLASEVEELKKIGRERGAILESRDAELHLARVKIEELLKRCFEYEMQVSCSLMHQLYRDFAWLTLAFLVQSISALQLIGTEDQLQQLKHQEVSGGGMGDDREERLEMANMQLREEIRQLTAIIEFDKKKVKWREPSSFY